MAKRFGNTNFYGKINGPVHTGRGNVNIAGERVKSFSKADIQSIYKNPRQKGIFTKQFNKLTAAEKQKFTFDMKLKGRASMPWRS